ncbi:hypothetical protein DFH05DRAFT_1473281 [Lentinula detonsa]|uniref:Secreted protein n=1 Tax=Lentinula detonsa TaxID=2804962 RepID=A0A9W8U1F4_9AGAR|nr:hypothetical protein DFH05DRAFT_1473281 [Lentinula detonsa]
MRRRLAVYLGMLFTTRTVHANFGGRTVMELMSMMELASLRLENTFWVGYFHATQLPSNTKCCCQEAVKTKRFRFFYRSFADFGHHDVSDALWSIKMLDTRKSRTCRPVGRAQWCNVIFVFYLVCDYRQHEMIM